MNSLKEITGIFFKAYIDGASLFNYTGLFKSNFGYFRALINSMKLTI